ncbi:MAG: hypothetical protein ABIR01_12490 [Candidatus Eisenbacteria bacterium]
MTATLDRRRFLIMLGGAAAYSALQPHSAWARRLARSTPMLQPWTLSEVLPGGTLEQARSLIGASVMAPSFWNSQPWRFEVEGSDVRITLDPTRVLTACDPDQRFAQMSLGCALENMLIAARAWGLQPTAQYLPWGLTSRPGAPLVVARVSWTSADQRRDRVLFHALTERRTNPRAYDGRAITMQNRGQLLAQAGDDVRVHWLEDRAEIARVADLVEEASRARSQERRAQSERVRWMRTSDDDAHRRGDGVSVGRLGLAGPTRWLAGRALRPGSRFFEWGSKGAAHDVRDAIRSSGALALVTLPRPSDAGWVVAGQTYERLALKAATLGIAQQPLSAPIESERHRAPLAKRFGATGEDPVLLVRLGHAKPFDPSPRRGVALVSTYRNS